MSFRHSSFLFVLAFVSIATLAFAPPSAPPFPQVSLGRDEVCVRDYDGSISCEGQNPYYSHVPNGSFTQFQAGWLHGCALSVDRTVACWGYNGDGRATSPHGHYLQVSVGHMHSCALTEEYRAVCWGDNSRGQSQIPPDLNDEKFIQVSAGGLFTCALREDGHVVCWGDNADGQATAPPDVFRWISAGGDHACGVRDAGDVLCWGKSLAMRDARFKGQLPSPVAPAEIVNQTNVRFVEVSSGERAACGLTTAGNAICWGDDTYGELNAPYFATFVEVSVGDHRACGVTHASEILCWGSEILLPSSERAIAGATTDSSHP